MIEELAVVTEVSGEQVLVTSEIKSTCSGCQQVDSCASGQIAKAIPQRQLQLKLDNTLQLKVGDKVVIGIVEKQLLSTAMQVYLLPLLGLIVFSAFGQYQVNVGFFSHEGYALLLGVLGAVLGSWVAKYFLSKSHKSHQLQPKIIRKACL